MKKNSLPKPVTILILTLLTAVIWVGLNIYRAVTVKPTSPVPESISKPLNPKLNTKVIQTIESAIFFPDSAIPPVNIEVKNTILPVLTPTPTTTPEASPAASPMPQT
jgi:hypothetical protein